MSFMYFYKLFIFYASHIIWPYVFVMIFLFYKGEKISGFYYMVLFVGLVLAYARFVEPRILLIKHTSIEIKKHRDVKALVVAVFSDTHFGIFKNAISAKKIVFQINKINPDLILIPGDFLYELEPHRIKEKIFPFKAFNAPVYAVTGNHDEGAFGLDYSSNLIEVLKENNIHVVNNSSELFSDKVQIFGLSDLWAKGYDLSVLDSLDSKKLNILISHNPDMTYKIPSGKDIDLIVSGHTHGGQIRIPFLYKIAIPSEYGFDKGLYLNKNSYSIFVTSGTGMIGLPMRFLMPPRIDILHINK